MSEKEAKAFCIFQDTVYDTECLRQSTQVREKKHTTETDGEYVLARGVYPVGGMTHVASLKFHGGELREILYNVMQRPVGHDQRAYSNGMLR